MWYRLICLMLVFIARKRANGTCGGCRGRTHGREPASGWPHAQAAAGLGTNREIVAERTELAALVLEIVDELGVFAVLAREDVLDIDTVRRQGGERDWGPPARRFHWNGP